LPSEVSEPMPCSRASDGKVETSEPAWVPATKPRILEFFGNPADDA
jgi:hypothetical protein